MALKITANSWFTHRYIIVDSAGVGFRETVAMGSELRFTFSQIDLVLLSPDNWLSFQVGQEVFRLPVRPDKPDHKQLMDVLVSETTRTVR
ncbi:MAG: hypothetical protein HY815_07490 [Candidatus Riflebacteria bacterium]|nr:hypothetical protein [Candidatus Riflebacteria bacterium]